MFTENLVKGFGFFTVAEFVKFHGSEQVDTSDYFFIIGVLGSSFQYIYDEEQHTIYNNRALYLAPNKIFKFVNPSDKENLVLVFSSDFYERSLVDAQMLNSELFFRSEPYVALVPIPIEEMYEDVSENKLSYKKSNRIRRSGCS